MEGAEACSAVLSALPLRLLLAAPAAWLESDAAGTWAAVAAAAAAARSASQAACIRLAALSERLRPMDLLLPAVPTLAPALPAGLAACSGGWWLLASEEDEEGVSVGRAPPLPPPDPPPEGACLLLPCCARFRRSACTRCSSSGCQKR